MENQVITNTESYSTTDGEVVKIFFEINNHIGSIKMYVRNTKIVDGIKHSSTEKIIIRGGVEY